jgi:hypothetical protein
MSKSLAQRLRQYGATTHRQAGGARNDAKLVQFGNHTPDVPSYEASGRIKNAIPVGQSAYDEHKSLAVISDALDARCQGATSGKQQSTGWTFHYAGDATKLYGLDGTAWTDHSKSGGYGIPSDETWKFAQYGDKIIACNIDNDVQSLDFGDTTFADHFTSTLTPKTRNLAVSKNFLFTGNNREGGVVHPTRLRWSAVGDSQDIDSDPNTQSDAQDIEGFGPIQHLVGRNYMTIFLKNGIVRATYVGDPAVWRFDEVSVSRGAYGPNTVASYGFTDFFLAEDGFFLWDGVQAQPVGEGIVNRTFFDDLDSVYKSRIFCLPDPANSCFRVSYVSNDATAGEPDKQLIYNYVSNRWAFVSFDHEFAWGGQTKGLGMDEIDSYGNIDTLPFSLDSERWTGGDSELAAFDTSHQYGAFTGTAYTAEFDTPEIELFPSQRGRVTRSRPIADGGTVTVQIGHRRRLADSTVFETAVAVNANGSHDHTDEKNTDRYHTGRVLISGGFNNAEGVELEGHPSGWNE